MKRAKAFPKGSFVLVGAPDDRGVRIVGGRVGARKGPQAIRKELLKIKNLPFLYDAGDIRLSGTQEETYKTLAKTVQKILEQGAFPIVLGGGHDLSFGSLSGFLKVYPQGGVLSIDPHFDCRQVSSKGRYSSGSAFRQLFERGRLKSGKFGNFGYQMERNTKDHYFFLKKNRAKLISETRATLPNFKKIARDLSRNGSALAVSFDLDAVNVAWAPGVSAINVGGFSAEEALAFVKAIAKNKKVRYLDWMEVNPAWDPDGRTARLTAWLIYHFVSGRISSCTS